MNFIVTAGPTYETLDQVRRLTNFSTGKLGTLLANYFADAGHDVIHLVSEQATYAGERHAQRIETFSTSASLQEWFQALATQSVDAIFHAAAVSDFSFGKIWRRSSRGDLTEVKAAKMSTGQGTLLAELVPTPKILGGLRDWFPKTKIVGWKYEVDGDRAGAIAAAERQVRESLTEACVANGRAYGEGFGLVTSNGKCTHLEDAEALFEALAKFTNS